MTDTTLPPTTRRRHALGALTALTLAACGGSGDSAGSSSNATLAGLNPAWPTR